VRDKVRDFCPAHDLLIDNDTIGARLSAETGLAYTPAAGGGTVSGT
jgi:hypothetical protein